MDDLIWDQLQRNEIVEVEADIKLVPGVAELTGVTALGAAAPLFDLMRSLPDSMLPDSFDRTQADEMSQQLPLMNQFAEQFANAPVPCTFNPLGSTRHKFFAELPREHLFADVETVEGEATILAKIQRHIVKGKPETVGSGMLPVIPANREQRRKQKNEAPLTVRLSYPAALVTVIGRVQPVIATA